MRTKLQRFVEDDQFLQGSKMVQARMMSGLAKRETGTNVVCISISWLENVESFPFKQTERIPFELKPISSSSNVFRKK